MEDKINDNHLRLILLAFGTIAALYIRYLLVPFISGDVQNCVLPWYDYIQANGLKGFKNDFSEYSQLYLYFLGFATFLPVAKLYAVKSISVFFDLLAAIFVYKLVKEKYKGHPLLPVFSYLGFLLAPTIVINSSVWGQCDIIYAAFIIISIYYLSKERKYANTFLGMVFYGLALSVKLQAAFLLPFYVLLWLNKRISLYHFLVIPAVYCVTVLPSFFAGRPFLNLLYIYQHQADMYQALTLSAPTIYQWLPAGGPELFTAPGILYALTVNLIVAIALWRCTSAKALSREVIVKAAFLFSMLMPFLLPRMHDRYFFVADALGILYAFYSPRYFYVGVAMNLTSFFCYGPALFRVPLFSINFLAFFVLVLIVIVAYDLFSGLLSKPALNT